MADEFDNINIFAPTDEDFGFPQPYVTPDIDTESIYSDLIIEPGKETEEFREKFTAPTLSDEQLAELYAPADYS